LTAWQISGEQRPVAEASKDRVLGSFERHQATELRLSTGLETDERILLFQGVLSNHRSQPVIIEWFGIRFLGNKPDGTRSLSELVSATKLNQGIPNPGTDLSEKLQKELESLLPSAVEEARKFMLELRNARAQEISKPLREGFRRVKAWHDRKIADLDKYEAALKSRQTKLRRDQQTRLNDDRNEVEKRYQARRDWIDDGMRTAGQPYLRVAAVLIPAGAE